MGARNSPERDGRVVGRGDRRRSPTTEGVARRVARTLGPRGGFRTTEVRVIGGRPTCAARDPGGRLACSVAGRRCFLPWRAWAVVAGVLRATVRRAARAADFNAATKALSLATRRGVATSRLAWVERREVWDGRAILRRDTTLRAIGVPSSRTPHQGRTRSPTDRSYYSAPRGPCQCQDRGGCQADRNSSARERRTAGLARYPRAITR